MKYLKVFENNITQLINSEKEEIQNFLLDINSRVGQTVGLEVVKATEFIYCRIGTNGKVQGYEGFIPVSPTDFDIIELSLEIAELKERMSEIGYEISNYHLDFMHKNLAGTGMVKVLLNFKKPI